MFAEMRPLRLYNHVTLSPFKDLSNSHFPLGYLQLFTSTVMTATTGDGGEEWMGMNDTRWRGLGLTDPIKNIEVRGCDIPPCHQLNPSRINGCCCPPFSR